MKIIINNPNPVRLAVGNDVMLDTRLTWAARGIFLHMAQLPNGTSISSESLASSSNPTVEVRLALKRLTACGYITFQVVDDESTYMIIKGVAITIATAIVKPKKKVVPGESTRFEDFWKLYPKKDYKVNALDVWKKMNLDSVADEVIAGLKAQIIRDGWSPENVQFILGPHKWLRGEGWKNMTQAQKDTACGLPPVFKVIGRTYTLELAPKREDFPSDSDFAMYEQAYKNWKQKNQP